MDGNTAGDQPAALARRILACWHELEQLCLALFLRPKDRLNAKLALGFLELAGRAARRQRAVNFQSHREYELGVKMGYDTETARQSVFQFLKSNDPRVSMLRRFAKAMDVPLSELLNEGKRPSRSK
jgi:hypothetical protein